MPSTNIETRRAETLASEQRDGLNVGNEAPIEAATCVDSTTPTRHDADRLAADLDRYAKALRWLNYARDWRIDNLPAWRAFEAYAAECVAEGKPLSGNALHAIVKRRDYVNVRTGKTSTLNRTVLPLFTRWLLRETPGLKVELRRSFFDCLFGEVGTNAEGE